MTSCFPIYQWCQLTAVFLVLSSKTFRNSDRNQRETSGALDWRPCRLHSRWRKTSTSRCWTCTPSRTNTVITKWVRFHRDGFLRFLFLFLGRLLWPMWVTMPSSFLSAQTPPALSMDGWSRRWHCGLVFLLEAAHSNNVERLGSNFAQWFSVKNLVQWLIFPSPHYPHSHIVVSPDGGNRSWDNKW